MKSYKIQRINKVKNNELTCEFPVLYPHVEYFKDINSVIATYGFILEKLTSNHFRIELFLEDMRKNPIMYNFWVERSFSIKTIKTQIEKVYDSESIRNRKKEKLFEIYYLNNTYVIHDSIDNTESFCNLYIDAKEIKLYLNGGACYIHDSNKNKMYCLVFG